jgi:NAD(P)-dependent dehydrogenase (short-subunit alcohol dehydrogenase family)
MPTLLLTGASRGIGLEFVKQYQADGWRVHACARNPDGAAELRTLAERAAGNVVVHTLDVTDFAAIDALARRLEGTPIDVLINCAGWMGSRSAERGGVSLNQFGNSDYVEWRTMFDLNSFAPMKMAEAFVRHVAASEQRRMVSLTSRMGSIADNTSGGYYAYRASKAALNAVVRSHAIDLAPHGIVATVIHPGWVRTDMGGPKAPLEVDASVRGMRKVIAQLKPEQAGRFWNYDGKEIPW